jgi:hypothetical protein
MMNFGMFVFDEKKLIDQIIKLDYAPFALDPDEPKFTVTQPIDGKDYTLHFVVRDGHMLFYDPNDTRWKYQ